MSEIWLGPGGRRGSNPSCVTTIKPQFPRGNKGAIRIPFLSFQFLRRPGCTAKLLCFHTAGGFESHRLHHLESKELALENRRLLPGTAAGSALDSLATLGAEPQSITPAAAPRRSVAESAREYMERYLTD